MILKVYSWYCTLCGHSKTYDPAVTEPPERCPACGEGVGYSYKYETKTERLVALKAERDAFLENPDG